MWPTFQLLLLIFFSCRFQSGNNFAKHVAKKSPLSLEPWWGCSFIHSILVYCFISTGLSERRHAHCVPLCVPFLSYPETQSELDCHSPARQAFSEAPRALWHQSPAGSWHVYLSTLPITANSMVENWDGNIEMLWPQGKKKKLSVSKHSGVVLLSFPSLNLTNSHPVTAALGNLAGLHWDGELVVLCASTLLLASRLKAGGKKHANEKTSVVVNRKRKKAVM